MDDSLRSEMEFPRLLLRVAQALRKDEIKALAFLCTDILKQDLSSVEATELFGRLTEGGLLSAEQPYLLADLLNTIDRIRLVRELKLKDQISMTKSIISPYRKLLYDLSKNINERELKKMKFLLTSTMQRTELETGATTLEVFQAMERKDILSDTNLTLLEYLMANICPKLKNNIQSFKMPEETFQMIQETGPGYGRPRSRSELSLPHKTPEDSLLETSASLQRSNSFQRLEDFRAHSDIATESFDSMRLSSNTSLEPLQTTRAAEEGLARYPMTRRRRGVCLIVNNYDFTNSTRNLKKREGTQVDEESLVHVFNWLGFETQVKNDCTKEQMLSLVQELGTRDHGQMDCLACCVLSHGLEGAVYGVDGGAVGLRELTEPFNGTRCASLREKPKMFFIQACQGQKEQQPCFIQADSPVSSSISMDASRVLQDSIACDADFLMSMPTVPGFVSLRDRNQGSWFIQSLCQNLVKMVPSGYDLVSILTKVNDDVSRMIDAGKDRKQMPQLAFTLRKQVVFPIPDGRPPVLQNKL